MWNGEPVHMIEAHRDANWSAIYVADCGISVDEQGLPNYWWTINPALVTCPGCLKARGDNE